MTVYAISRPADWDAGVYTGFRISGDPAIRRQYQRCELNRGPASKPLQSMTIEDCGYSMIQVQGETAACWLSSLEAEFRKMPIGGRGFVVGGAPAFYSQYQHTRDTAPQCFGVSGQETMMAQCSIAVPFVKRFGARVDQVESLPSVGAGFGFYFFVEDIRGNRHSASGEDLMIAYQFNVFETRPSQVVGRGVLGDGVVSFVITTPGDTYASGGFIEPHPGSANARTIPWQFPMVGVPQEAEGNFYRFYITPRCILRVIDQINEHRANHKLAPISKNLSTVRLRSMHTYFESTTNTARYTHPDPGDDHLAAGACFHAPACFRLRGVEDYRDLQILVPPPGYVNAENNVFEWGIGHNSGWLDPQGPRIGLWPSPHTPLLRWTARLQYCKTYKTDTDVIRPPF